MREGRNLYYLPLFQGDVRPISPPELTSPPGGDRQLEGIVEQGPNVKHGELSGRGDPGRMGACRSIGKSHDTLMTSSYIAIWMF